MVRILVFTVFCIYYLGLTTISIVKLSLDDCTFRVNFIKYKALETICTVLFPDYLCFKNILQYFLSHFKCKLFLVSKYLDENLDENVF